MWSLPELDCQFDLILEDGLHEFEANVLFFENSVHKLQNNGYYIIEDIKNEDIVSMCEKCKEWESKYSVKASVYRIQNQYNNHDNNIVVMHKKIEE
jgi:hypothetical protein